MSSAATRVIPDEDNFQDNSDNEGRKYDKRTFWEVLAADLQNYVYFFTPLVVIYNLAW